MDPDAHMDVEDAPSETEDNVDEFIDFEDEIEIESEDDDIIPLDFQDMFFTKDETVWLKEPLRKKRQRSKNLIKTPPGVVPQVPTDSSIADIFKLFISPDIIQQIVTFTNQRGNYETNKHNNGEEDMVWKNVDEMELYAFIGLLICSGALKGNREPIGMLWKTDPCFQRPIFSATMPRTRFSQVSSWMRFDNRDTRQERRETDKLAPIRDVAERFIHNCQKYYNPGSHLTIDEQLVPFRGRCPFRVYMKSKPAKYGIKVWILADVETSYCKNFQIYLGKQGRAPEVDQGKRVVMDLVSCLGSGYGITTDNFFTSLELAEVLLDQKLTLCGTLRRTRTFIPAEFLPSRNRPEYSSIFAFQPEITMVSYVPKKNRSVILLSSEHCDGTVGDDERKKPEIIGHYNATKGAVDTLDKIVAEYSCNRQSKRWPAVIFMNFIDIAAVNAFVLWKKLNPEWKAQCLDKRRLFLLELGKQLVEPHMRSRLNNAAVRSRLNKTTIQNITAILHDIGNHPNDNQEEQVQQEHESRKRGRCHVCSRTTDKKVTLKCTDCKNFVCPAHSKTIKICYKCEK